MRGIHIDGDAIRDRRNALGWTQEKLAAEVGCNPRTIRNAEQGKPIDANTLSAIALSMRISLAELTFSEQDQQQRHIEIVHEWLHAFHGTDIPRLLAFHHPESVLEIPGAEGLAGVPEPAVFKGLEALHEHFTNMFSQFRLLRVLQQTFDTKGDLVFHRATSTMRGNETGREATTKFYNEFEFRDGLIIRRVTISDLAGHRHILGMD